LASLDPKDTEGPVINALRKEVTPSNGVVKSGKLVPLPFSSRHYSFKLKKWTFGKATDEEIAHMVERRCTGRRAWWAETSGWAIRPSPVPGHHCRSRCEIAAGLAQQGLSP